MPKNSQQLIASYQDVSDTTLATLSPQSSGIRLRQIPAGTVAAPIGTEVFLPPDDPSDGDTYEVIDADGSCNVTAPILITPPAGTTIANESGSFGLAGANIIARFTYEADETNWIPDLGALSLVEQQAETGGTFGGQVVPETFTPTAAGTALFACEVFPRLAGFYRVSISFQVEPNADDTVSIVLFSGAGPASISGGTAVPASPLPFAYEGPTPLVIAAGPLTVKANQGQAVTSGEVTTISIVAI